MKIPIKKMARCELDWRATRLAEKMLREGRAKPHVGCFSEVKVNRGRNRVTVYAEIELNIEELENFDYEAELNRR